MKKFDLLLTRDHDTISQYFLVWAKIKNQYYQIVVISIEIQRDHDPESKP
jgi:hypothetical protein